TVRVRDPRTVAFTFKSAFYSNLDAALTLPVLARHFYDRFDAPTINRSTGLLRGSGPFRLATLDPDHQWAPPDPVVLIRNERSWAGRPPLDTIRFKGVTDAEARLTEYRAGEAQMITPTSPRSEERRVGKARSARW